MQLAHALKLDVNRGLVLQAQRLNLSTPSLLNANPDPEVDVRSWKRFELGLTSAKSCYSSNFMTVSEDCGHLPASQNVRGF